MFTVLQQNPTALSFIFEAITTKKNEVDNKTNFIRISRKVSNYQITTKSITTKKNEIDDKTNFIRISRKVDNSFF